MADVHWSDADLEAAQEMAAAEHAYTRLAEQLRQVDHDLQISSSQSARLKRFAGKREAALQTLLRHANAVIAEFAFIDGHRVDGPDPRLLEVFYPDPMECVTARYCWALLRQGSVPASLAQIVAATSEEYAAFASLQASEAIIAVQTAAERDRLAHAESRHRLRADRLAYRLAALRRLSIVLRHIRGADPSTRSLDAEVAQALETAEDAADILRQVRHAKRARR